MWGKSCVFIVVLGLQGILSVKADYLEARRNVGIKEAPSKEASVVYTASVGETFTLLNNGSQIKGYYEIVIPNGKSGYVFRTMVFIHKGNKPPDSFQIDKASGSFYHDSLFVLEGDNLKLALHQSIRNHKVFSYDETWEILFQTDRDPNNPDHVVLIYTMRSQPASQRDRGTRYDYEKNGYSLMNAWNREHIWPKSHGFPNPTDTAYTDLHHLRPADRSVNSARNTRSFDFGEVIYLDNGNSIPTPNKTHSSLWCWEPPDEVKGDIARMLFYMAVRYEGPDYDLELVDEVLPRLYKLPHIGKLSTLLKWHLEDPVDEREVYRNELIYSSYQGNRNPFIDHPDWVGKIWK